MSLFLTILTSAIDLASFSAILYSIYPPLFAVLIAYSSTGTALTLNVGKRLVGLNFMQSQRQADLRYSLVRIIENAESIAFYRGEEPEKREVQRRLGEVIGNFGNLIKWERNLDYVQTAYQYLIQVCLNTLEMESRRVPP